MSRKKIWQVELSADDRKALKDFTRKGKAAARELTRAHALLLLDESELGPAKSIEEVSDVTGLAVRSLLRIRKVCCEETPFTAVRHRTPVHTKPKKLDGEGEARLIALACSEPPEGRAKWTLRLLADKMVELEIVDEIAHETVRRILKKTNLNLT
jgi:hypothetical protein